MARLLSSTSYKRHNPTCASFKLTSSKDLDLSLKIVAIETLGGKRNLNMNINAQQAILNAYIFNNSSLYKDFIC